MGNSSAASFSNSMNNSVSFAKFNPTYSSPPQNAADVVPSTLIHIESLEVDTLQKQKETPNEPIFQNKEVIKIGVVADKKAKINTSQGS